MPKATVSTETVRHHLVTLSGAWVDLRRLSFGEKQMRQDMAMKMAFAGGGNTKEDVSAVAEMSAAEVAYFEFSRCIVDHNLYYDDEETEKMDFTKRRDFEQLDPRVGDEIDSEISHMNNFDVTDLGNGSSES